MEYILKSSIAVNFIKKEPVTGSYNGMRYKIYKAGDDIGVCIWPEPYNYLKTQEELKQYEKFPLSEEGKDACVDWLNQQIDDQAKLWESARNTSWI